MDHRKSKRVLDKHLLLRYCSRRQRSKRRMARAALCPTNPGGLPCACTKINITLDINLTGNSLPWLQSFTISAILMSIDTRGRKLDLPSGQQQSVMTVEMRYWSLVSQFIQPFLSSVPASPYNSSKPHCNLHSVSHGCHRLKAAIGLWKSKSFLLGFHGL